MHNNDLKELRVSLLQFVQQALALGMDEVTEADPMQSMFAGLRDVMRSEMVAYVDRYLAVFGGTVTTGGPECNAVEVALTFEGITKTVRFELKDFLPVAIAQILDGQQPSEKDNPQTDGPASPQPSAAQSFPTGDQFTRRRGLRSIGTV